MEVPKQWKREHEKWNLVVKNVHGSGSSKMFTKQLANYILRSVSVQDVTWDMGALKQPVILFTCLHHTLNDSHTIGPYCDMLQWRSLFFCAETPHEIAT